ncbi:MAG: TolC family protein [Planctomycetes bacterium]|nr:TolC family protein [Planctomycetota bacterium]
MRTASALVAVVPALLAAGCKSPADYVAEADAEVYEILDAASLEVTGEVRRNDITRGTDTLRTRLLEQPADVPPLHLSLIDALEATAENSREFQRQKESLYRTALNLTRQRWNFDWIWSGGAGGEVSGVGDDSARVSFSDDLRASANSTAGTRIVAGFVNSFLRSITSSDNWDGSSILNLSITQPLLRGFGTTIVREPLTQAERDVVYAVRTFERFRKTLAVDVVSSYIAVLQQQQNLDSERANLASVRQSRERSEALFGAGRVGIDDVDRARQNELSAENRIVNAENRLATSLDSFKLLLGLPCDARVELDPEVFQTLEALGVAELALNVDDAVELALARRYDHRTVRDEVADSARQILIGENALESILDLSGAVSVPTEPGEPLNFDWSRVDWSAGFNLDLALARLPERNTYRSALISLNEAIRRREESEDRIKQQIRVALRDISTRVANYRIQQLAVELAERRVDSTRELYEANRVQALAVLDAQEALLVARIGLTGAIVDFVIARLELLRDLEAIELDSTGLRFDLDLPLPTGPEDTEDARRAAERAAAESTLSQPTPPSRP